MSTRMQKIGRALGSEVVLTIIVNRSEQSIPIFNSLWASIVAFEKRFSRFRTTSELSMFNASAGLETKISPAFRKLLVTAKKYSEMTDGLYNPFILPSLNRAGYIGSWPNPDQYNQDLNYSIRQMASIDKLMINKASALIPANSALDFGGIGKGYLLDQLARQLFKFKIKDFWLSLGGDIITSGFDIESKPWKIGIADIKNEDEASDFVINTKGNVMAVATSGVTYRSGIGWHHIIDPRSNHSANTDILSSTVIADSGIEADVYAKCLLILGSKDAKSFTDRRATRAIVQTLANSGKKALHYGEAI